MTRSGKVRKTTWNDYHAGNVECRGIVAGTLIKEAHGRWRIRAECPFCGEELEICLWHCEKRCGACGAICAGSFSFKVKEVQK